MLRKRLLIINAVFALVLLGLTVGGMFGLLASIDTVDRMSADIQQLNDISDVLSEYDQFDPAKMTVLESRMPEGYRIAWMDKDGRVLANSGLPQDIMPAMVKRAPRLPEQVCVTTYFGIVIVSKTYNQTTLHVVNATQTYMPIIERNVCLYISVLLVALLLIFVGSIVVEIYVIFPRLKRLREAMDQVYNGNYEQTMRLPNGKHRDEINERMQALLVEADDWKKLQKSVNRKNVSSFLQKHPNSLRQRACEDMLDSIDWADALSIGNEEAITDYLHRHPSGRFVDDAAERKNALLLSKVTPEEKAMIRGTLESFFSKVIGGQDLEAAKAAIPDTMVNFCGKQNADAEAIIEYAKEKMAKDVIGLHYALGQKMDVRKETLPDSNTGFSVEVSLHETISRSDTNLPSSNHYRVNALINQIVFHTFCFTDNFVASLSTRRNKAYLLSCFGQLLARKFKRPVYSASEQGKGLAVLSDPAAENYYEILVVFRLVLCGVKSAVHCRKHQAFKINKCRGESGSQNRIPYLG